MKRALALTAALAAATTLAACGSDTEPAADEAATTTVDPTVRRIDVAMTDMAFDPAQLDIAAGETVQFVFRNDGAVAHEAVIGTMEQQLEHHEEMAATGDHGDMDMDGEMGMDEMETGSMPHDGMDELHGVLVQPGETVEMMHTFDAAGPTMVGCHEPGHWEAGMKLDIVVT